MKNREAIDYLISNCEKADCYDVDVHQAYRWNNKTHVSLMFKTDAIQAPEPYSTCPLNILRSLQLGNEYSKEELDLGLELTKTYIHKFKDQPEKLVAHLK